MNLFHHSILIVDDSATVRVSLKRTLIKMGASDISDAANIQDGWEIFNQRKIDLIFCDWHMGGGDGILLLDKIRSLEDEEKKYSLFIMITGGKEKAFEAMDRGANQIIHKPFDLNDIIYKLNIIKNAKF